MNTELNSEPSTATPQRTWRPLTSLQRRVAGVLIEKAKTTRDAYPLTLNALTTGCNQKSNRDPIMALTPDQIETTLDELREMGAVIEVQSGGRVPKYRHCMYEWLGVDKVELAVVAELLLRGPQTAGALRSHVSRMDKIADLETLHSLLKQLMEKELVVALSPPGRGQVFAHNLYRERELEQLKQQFASGRAPATTATTVRGVSADEFARLKAEVAELRERLEQLIALVQQSAPAAPPGTGSSESTES